MLSEVFGKCPQVKSIDFLLAHPFYDYTKKEIAQGSEISRMTLNNFIDTFLEFDILVKEEGKYSLNKNSNIIQIMNQLQEELSNMEAEKQIATFSEDPIKLSDDELDQFLDVNEDEIEFDEDNELVLVEKGSLKHMKELESQYIMYKDLLNRQNKVTEELLNSINLSKNEYKSYGPSSDTLLNTFKSRGGSTA